MYPVLLDIAGKLCVVVGGGSVAERKVRGLLESGAQVRVVSPEVTRELALWAEQGKISWRRTVYLADDLAGAVLVFAATSEREVQQAIARDADEKGLPVNVVDDPATCSFHVPAVVRRGDLILSVSTGGSSPAVAAHIREQLEENFGPEYEALLQIMSKVRELVGAWEHLSQQERKKLYKKILHRDIISWIRNGQVDTLRAHLHGAMGVTGPELENLMPKPDTQ